MKLIGLTGNIASGKSTVAALFRSFGITVVDADWIAKETITPIIVQKYFGTSFLNKNEINRARFRQFIFENILEKNKIENISHPLIMRNFNEKMFQLRKEKYIVCEISLIFEKELENLFDEILFVITSDAIRKCRLKLRNDIFNVATSQCIINVDNLLTSKDSSRMRIINNNKTKLDLERKLKKIFNCWICEK